MGYTHYWSHGDIEPAAWSGLLTDAKRIINEAGVKLAGLDGSGEPVLDQKEIALNGVAPDDLYESFVIKTWGTDFDFCKTQYRPYDLVVCAVLLRAALTVPGFRVKSDGDWDSDWKAARELYAKLFGPAPDESPLRST